MSRAKKKATRSRKPRVRTPFGVSSATGFEPEVMSTETSAIDEAKPVPRMALTHLTTTRPAEPVWRKMVAMAAYYRAESRGFVPGYDVEDWIAAERELEGRFA